MMRDGRGPQSPSGPPEEKHPNLGKNDHVFSAKANYSYDTHGLVAAYHRAALSHGIVGGVQAPEGQHEKQCIDELKKAFSQAISYLLGIRSNFSILKPLFRKSSK